MTPLTVEQLAALLDDMPLPEAQEMVDGDSGPAAEWLLPRLGESTPRHTICRAVVGIRGFDGMCTRGIGHRGTHYDSRYDVEDREDKQAAPALPREPYYDRNRAVIDILEQEFGHSDLHVGLAQRIVRAIDGVRAGDAGEGTKVKIQLNAEGLQALLRRMVGTHGKAAAVEWLLEEWKRQPEAMFDAFIGGPRAG